VHALVNLFSTVQPPNAITGREQRTTRAADNADNLDVAFGRAADNADDADVAFGADNADVALDAICVQRGRYAPPDEHF
jgi:hypothetical protein